MYTAIKEITEEKKTEKESGFLPVNLSVNRSVLDPSAEQKQIDYRGRGFS